jgi:hypothetical protein
MGWLRYPDVLYPVGFAAVLAAWMLASRPITRRSALLSCLAVLISSMLAVNLAWFSAENHSPLWHTFVVLGLCALVYLAALAILAAIAMTTTDHATVRAQRLALISISGVFASLLGLLFFAIFSSGD